LHQPIAFDVVCSRQKDTVGSATVAAVVCVTRGHLFKELFVLVISAARYSTLTDEPMCIALGNVAAKRKPCVSGKNINRLCLQPENASNAANYLCQRRWGTTEPNFVLSVAGRIAKMQVSEQNYLGFLPRTAWCAGNNLRFHATNPKTSFVRLSVKKSDAAISI
jgi:hypothetical protein